MQDKLKRRSFQISLNVVSNIVNRLGHRSYEAFFSAELDPKNFSKSEIFSSKSILAPNSKFDEFLEFLAKFWLEFPDMKIREIGQISNSKNKIIADF